MAEPEECVECGSTVPFEIFEAEQTFQYGPDESPDKAMITAKVPVHRCTACGFSYTDGEGEDARDAAVQMHLDKTAQEARAAAALAAGARPGRRNDEAHIVDLTGYLSPFLANGQPRLLEMPGMDRPHLVCFSSMEKLLAHMTRIGVPFAKVVTITDGKEFFDSVKEFVTVAIDPYVTEHGTTRWRQLFTGGELPPLLGEGTDT